MIKRLRNHFAENKPASAFSLSIWTMIYLLGAILLLVFGDSPADIAVGVILILVGELNYVGGQIMKKLEQMETKPKYYCQTNITNE